MFFLRTKMLMLFYRELSQMVGSGIPVIEAMNILRNQAPDPRLKYISGQIRELLLQGSSLGEAFAEFPDMFPALQANIIRYTETSGRPAQGLERLANYLQKEYALQQGLIVGLAYPVILLHLAVFLLPVVNAVTCGLLGYIRGLLGLIFPLYAVVFLVYALFRMRSNERFKTGFDRILLSVPVIGKVVKQLALTGFIRALQILTDSGVSIITAWTMASDSCFNNAVKSDLLKGLESIEKGRGLSNAFLRAGVFSPHILSMVTTAEKSGSIVQTLNIIADYSEKENETALAMLTRIVPVIVYMLVAGFIAFRVISFYCGYFDRIFSPLK